MPIRADAKNPVEGNVFRRLLESDFAAGVFLVHGRSLQAPRARRSNKASTTCPSSPMQCRNDLP